MLEARSEGAPVQGSSALRKVSVQRAPGGGAPPRNSEEVPQVAEEEQALKSVQRARLAGRLREHQRKRVAECRCVRVAPEVTLVERYALHVDGDGVVSEAGGRLVFRGVKTCGSVHSCPMCAAVILRTRAEEVSQALDRCRRDRTAFVTFTMRHAREMALGALRKVQALAYSEMKAGRTGAELKAALGYVGDVKAAEQTWGSENGWHPHLHTVWTFDAPPPANFGALLFERWRTCLENAHRRLREVIRYFVFNRGPVAQRRKDRGEKYTPGDMGTDSQRAFAVKMFGRRYVHKHDSLMAAALWFWRDLKTLGRPRDFLPDDTHGVHAELAETTRELADYLAKLGLELNGIADKTSKPGHFTSWDIARRAAEGEARFIGLWKEHAAAMLGARQLTWSRGLREAVGLEQERSDEELAQDELAPTEIERLIGVVPGRLWDQRVRHSGQDVVAELLGAYAKRSTRDHELVTPRDGERDVTLRQDVAPVWWERWRSGAAALARGRDRLPPKPRKASVQGPQGRGYLQRVDDCLNDLREVLWTEHGIG